VCAPAIVFDLVQPLAPCGRLAAQDRRGSLYEAEFRRHAENVTDAAATESPQLSWMAKKDRGRPQTWRKVGGRGRAATMGSHVRHAMMFPGPSDDPIETRPGSYGGHPGNRAGHPRSGGAGLDEVGRGRTTP
jgi:hypothetical protein